MQLVILDRDGVINHDSPNHIRTPDELIPIPGSLEAIARLHQAGVKVVVATNQSGIRRRLFNVETLNAIHSKLHRMVTEIGGHIDAIVFCPHAPRDGCACRKPSPGMLLTLTERLRVACEDAIFVGDKATDVQAALAANIRPVLVLTGHGAREVHKAGALTDLTVHENLASFTDRLLLERSTRDA